MTKRENVINMNVVVECPHYKCNSFTLSLACLHSNLELIKQGWFKVFSEYQKNNRALDIKIRLRGKM